MPSPTLVITLVNDNAVRIEGTINDQITSYGMLVLAMFAIRDFNMNTEQEPERKIITPDFPGAPIKFS